MFLNFNILDFSLLTIIISSTMPSNKSVKICGLTRYNDLLLADDLGADYFGFILYEGSPRCLKQAQLKHTTIHSIYTLTGNYQ